MTLLQVDLNGVPVCHILYPYDLISKPVRALTIAGVKCDPVWPNQIGVVGRGVNALRVGPFPIKRSDAVFSEARSLSMCSGTQSAHEQEERNPDRTVHPESLM